MKKLTIIFYVAIILVGAYYLYNHYQEQKTNGNDVPREFSKEYIDSSNKKLEQRLSNIDFAGEMTKQEIRLGMSSKNARKYEKHLIDSLNNETDSARDQHIRDDVEKDKREQDSLSKE